jgi:hypothetical protein
MYKQKMIVIAIMVLRNFIRDHGGKDIDFIYFNRDSDFVPTIPERYNKYAMSQCLMDQLRTQCYNYRCIS